MSKKFFDFNGDKIAGDQIYVAVQGFIARNPDGNNEHDVVICKRDAERRGDSADVRSAPQQFLPITSTRDQRSAAFAKLSAPPLHVDDDPIMLVTNTGDGHGALGTRL